MKRSLCRLSILSFILLMCLTFGCKQGGPRVQAGKAAGGDLALKKMPEVVKETLKAKFPGLEIQKWTKEKEGDIVVYDVEFKQEGRKLEADVKEDGSIHNWEKEIMAGDLPEAVKAAVGTNYPQSTLKEVMEITTVTDGVDALEGYEVVLNTAAGEEMEVTMAPDGKILEDSGEEKPEGE